MPPASFLQALEQDVRKTTNGTRTAHLIVYVHGLGVTFPTAVAEGAQFGLHFQAKNVDNDGTGTTTCTPVDGKLPKDCILCPQDARKGLEGFGPKVWTGKAGVIPSALKLSLGADRS